MVKRNNDIYWKREVMADHHLAETDWIALERLGGMQVHQIGNQSFVRGADFCSAVERLAAIVAAI